MLTYSSRRYGDLQKLHDKTDGRCHLCHQEVDLVFYGRPGSFGVDTVNVDHLVPQAHGGPDDHWNLRLAHATCNQLRGTAAAEDVRLALTGTADEPFGTVEKNLLSLAVGGVAYGAGGALFARERPDGTRAFNHGAAVLAALLVGLAVRSSL
jgi:hypothetical protein